MWGSRDGDRRDGPGTRTAPSPSSIDTAVVFLSSLLVGAMGIHVGVTLVADRDVGIVDAAFTALLGAIAGDP